MTKQEHRKKIDDYIKEQEDEMLKHTPVLNSAIRLSNVTIIGGRIQAAKEIIKLLRL